MGAHMPNQRFLWLLNYYQRKSQNFYVLGGANANLGRNLGRNLAILRNPRQLLAAIGLVGVLICQIKDFYDN